FLNPHRYVAFVPFASRCAEQTGAARPGNRPLFCATCCNFAAAKQRVRCAGRTVIAKVFLWRTLRFSELRLSGATYMPCPLKSPVLPALLAGPSLSLSGPFSYAAEPAPPPPPPDWWSTVTATGLIDAGVTFNPQLPPDGLNFGQLYTDKANSPLLNG